MVTQVDILIDVTEAIGLGEPAHIAASIVLPEPRSLVERPIVCFAKPGGAYSKGYFTFELPGASSGSQAAWHAARGWVFVAIDPLGSGGSSIVSADKLTFGSITTANFAAEQEILLRLANGVVAPGYPPVNQPLKICIGQSLGGCLTIVQQGRFQCYDGICVLGFSAIHSHPPVPPGATPIVVPWISRDCPASGPPEILNRDAIVAAAVKQAPDRIWRAIAWGFFFDDVPRHVVEQNLTELDRIMFGASGNTESASLPWISYNTPASIGQSIFTPGVVAAEAAAVCVPVLCAMGVRDLVPDPHSEARAFTSAQSVDIFVCPRMGHMHNFATTRELMWQRIDSFTSWCHEYKSILNRPDNAAR